MREVMTKPAGVGPKYKTCSVYGWMGGLSLTVTDPRNALDKMEINGDLLLQWVGDGICQGLSGVLHVT